MQNFDTENAFFFHNKTYINKIGEMVSFELGKEIKKDVFVEMVSFELGKEIKKDVFVLSQAWDVSLSHASDKTKNIFL